MVSVANGFARPKDPVFNTAGYGEPGHYFKMRPKPTDANPLRAVIRFPCGSATFNSPESAREFLKYPGDVGHAARFYLAETGTDR